MISKPARHHPRHRPDRFGQVAPRSTPRSTRSTRIDKKILTIEDPIEYRINGVTQVQVKPQIDLTFARVLRTFLRQDPDVIMVGETRDPETAQIAIQAALTGHLVFSTLHTNDAAGAVTRLLDMGIEPFLIAARWKAWSPSAWCACCARTASSASSPGPEVIARLQRQQARHRRVSTLPQARAARSAATRVSAAARPSTRSSRSTRISSRLIVEREPANVIKQQAIATGMRTHPRGRLDQGARRPDHHRRGPARDHGGRVRGCEL